MMFMLNIVVSPLRSLWVCILDLGYPPHRVTGFVGENLVKWGILISLSLSIVS